ncbi:MAG: L,D-transpeptidase family protein [Candidatus Omnitrophica bacterium]|nr:L,D-transpeptidase family protein [Candidatus Omnitrophota bacterium]MCM8791050.1 L,D-transpeptidase family protein [Candidatus Omnitrophota bacterium]
MNKKIIIAMMVAVVAVAAAFLSYKVITSFKTAEKDITANKAISIRKVETIFQQDAAIKKAESVIAAGEDSPKAEEAYLTLASIYSSRNDFLKAREFYRKAMEKFPASANIPKIQQAIENLNVKILFSPTMTDDSFLYQVKKGDNLVKIANKFGTTVELIKKSNGLKGSDIRIGQKLKLTKLKFSIVIDRSQNILTLKADGNAFKTYRVATGKEGSPTPVGTFKITNKIMNPPWYKLNGKMIPAGDPKNELGSRWLGLSKPSYGIHGTIDPDSIGKFATEGCVRLKNEDIEEIFDIVPQGTEVVIIE